MNRCPVVLSAVVACMILLAIVSPRPVGGGPMPGGDASTSEEASAVVLADTVSMLLGYVRDSGCVFIRNGREHDSAAAAKHMERKYRHFRDDIETPEDFIRLAATKSTMSGKPYRVRTPEGDERLSADWLADALAAMRRPASPPAAADTAAGLSPDTPGVPQDSSAAPADTAVSRETT